MVRHAWPAICGQHQRCRLALATNADGAAMGEALDHLVAPGKAADMQRQGAKIGRMNG
jgi:hypothetical protein